VDDPTICGERGVVKRTEMQAQVGLDDQLSQFLRKQYLALESYRRDGRPVRTPVWFLEDNNRLLYIVTDSKSGKVRRIRKNPYVRVVPCSYKGNPEGRWLDAEATLLEEDGASEIKNMLNHKYGLVGKMARFYYRITRRKQTQVVIRVRIRPRGNE
jgi:PPOX class probable F420-dependent enzyme